MNIAIIDDQEDIQYAVEKILKKEGHTCYGFYGNEADLIDAFEVFDIDLVIIDMMLEYSLTGLDISKKLKEHDFHIPAIMITAYTTPSNMIEASKSGITDIIKKPFSSQDIIETVNKYKENTKTTKLSFVQDNEEFIGSFETMKEAYKNIGIAANNSENIFVYGETGTGKELVSKLIHKNSNRADKPFIAVNCSTIPENMFEKLMFGRAENYFKNDSSKHMGYVQQCGDGTLFLDGVYNLTVQSQLKLSRFLESKSYYPLGSTKEVKFKGRIITTSTKTPKELLEDENFKNDLYYRMSTLEIGLPNLQKRKKDIKDLSEYFVKLHNKEFELNYKGIEKEALDLLENHHFYGNVRELKSTIYKAMISSSKNTVTLKSLQEIMSRENSKNVNDISIMCNKLLEIYEFKNIDKIFEDFEKEMIKILLHKYQNITKLSKALKMSRNTLKDKIKKYKIV